MKLNTLTLAIALAAVNAPAAAEEYDAGLESEEIKALEEVVVEATRAPLTVMDIPVNTSIIDTQVIRESSTSTIDELLRQVPGFNMLRASDSISSAPVINTVSLRGLGGNAASRTLVLLDGIPLNNAHSSEIYWSRVPKHQIERVEVVRGAGANSWGNLSMGGVINIVTAKPRDDGIDFSASVGDPLTWDLSAGLSQVHDRWSYSVFAEYYDTDGYPKLPAELAGPIDVNAWKENVSVGGRAEYQASDQVRVFFGGSWFDEERGAGTPLDVNQVENSSIDAGIEMTTGDGSSWTFRTFYDSTELEDYTTRVNSDRDSETIRTFRIQPTEALGTGLVWSKELAGGHTLTAGADYRWTDMVTSDWTSFSGMTPRSFKKVTGTQDMGGVFIQDTWQVNDRWQVSGSLRYDYFVNEGSDYSMSLTSGEITDRNHYARNSESTVNPNLGTVFRLNETVSLRAAVYEGFRAPTLRELYRTGSSRGGVTLVNNPYLAPERLVGIEGGADWFINPNTVLRLTVFRNTVQDQIQNVTRGITGDAPAVIKPCGLLGPNETCRELGNVGEMQALGVEIEADWTPHPDWDLQFSYLFNDTEVTKAPDNPQLIGTQIRQAPKNAFTARARHRGQWFNTSLVARYVGKRYEDDLATLEVDDHLLFDLRFARQVSDRTEVFLTIENLLDEEYPIRMENDGYYEIGRPRFVYVGLNYRR